MHQLDLYEVLPIENQAVDKSPDALSAWAESHKTDYILFGSIGMGASGGLVCGLSLFDRAKGVVALSNQSQQVSILDVFDAEDELIATMLNAMTGRHIGFGRIALTNSGVKGGYSVILDGMEAGQDIDSVEAVLNGSHTIVVVQKRMFGDMELVKRNFSIAEGETFDVDFSIPELTEAERARLESLESEVRRDWTNPSATDQVAAKVEEFASLTKDTSYSVALASYSRRAKQLAGEWNVMSNRLEILGKAWEPDPELLDPSIAAFLMAKSYPDSETIKSMAKKNAEILAAFLELMAGEAAKVGDYAKAEHAIEGILGFSRYLPGERISQYASVASELRGVTESKGDPAAKEEAAAQVLGSRFSSGALFHESCRSASIILLPSDLDALVSVDGGPPESGVRTIRPEGGSVAIAKGKGVADEKLKLDLSPGARILYADIGFSPFPDVKSLAALNAEKTTKVAEPVQAIPPPAPEKALTSVSSVAPNPITVVSSKPSGGLVEMICVQGGDFQMGGFDGHPYTMPAHKVELTDFYIGKYEVTQAQYKAVMETNPSYFIGDELPVEEISWYDAVAFCNALSVREGLQKVYAIDGAPG